MPVLVGGAINTVDPLDDQTNPVFTGLLNREVQIRGGVGTVATMDDPEGARAIIGDVLRGQELNDHALVIARYRSIFSGIGRQGKGPVLGDRAGCLHAVLNRFGFDRSHLHRRPVFEDRLADYWIRLQAPTVATDGDDHHPCDAAGEPEPSQRGSRHESLLQRAVARRTMQKRSRSRHDWIDRRQMHGRLLHGIVWLFAFHDRHAVGAIAQSP